MSTQEIQRVGGSFAPPLTTELLAEYKALANAAERSIKDRMLSLIKTIEVFNETPESALAGTPHPSHAKAMIVPLEEKEIERIWDYVPYMEELDAMGLVFEQLTGPIRNAAFHLKWYVTELTLDREPITKDKVQTEE